MEQKTLVLYLEARRFVDTVGQEYHAKARELTELVRAENDAARKYRTIGSMWDRVIELAKEQQPQ